MASNMERVVAAACIAALLGCSSETVIRSNVPARVFVDGAFVGNTPYTLSDTKIVGSTTSIRLEAPGFAPTNVSLHRSEEFDVVACIGGVFLLVPFLWIMGYKADHSYELMPAGPQPYYQPGFQQPPPGQYPPPQGQYPQPQPGQYPPPQGQYPQPAPQPQPGY
jgi:hypothetical protein